MNDPTSFRNSDVTVLRKLYLQYMEFKIMPSEGIDLIRYLPSEIYNFERIELITFITNK